MMGTCEQQRHDEGVQKKRPSATYSRKSCSAGEVVAVSEKSLKQPSVGDEPITDHNFARKLLEVFKPSELSQNSPAAQHADDSLKEEEEGKRHCVKNVHELLESGSSNRLYEEVDYLVSGLEALPRRGKVKERHAYFRELSKLLFSGEISRIEESALRTKGIVQRICTFVEQLGKVHEEEEDDLRSYKFLLVLIHTFYNGHPGGDGFISPCACLKVCLPLISFDESINIHDKKNTTSNSKESSEVFKRTTSNTYAELSVWLLHRMILTVQMKSMRMSAKNDDVVTNNLLRNNSERLVEQCGLLLMSKNCPNIHACILGIMLYILQMGVEICKIAADVVSFYTQPNCPINFSHLNSIITGLTILVAITGGDEGAIIVSNDPVMLDVIRRIFMEMSGRHGEEVDILISAIIANVTDRNAACRRWFLDNREFVDHLLPTILCQNECVSRFYYGMTFGILLFDEVSKREEYYRLYPDLRDIIAGCFRNLLTYLQQSGYITEELQIQLHTFSKPYGNLTFSANTA